MRNRRRDFMTVLSGGSVTPFSQVYFEDNFIRADGALGADWTGDTFAISSNAAIGTPTGTEKLTNGAFTTDLAGWTQSNNSGADRIITNVDPAVGHGGGGSGGANVYSNMADYVRLRQAIVLNTNKYTRLDMSVSYVGGGSLQSPFAVTTVSVHSGLRGVVANIDIRNTAAAADITVDYISVLELNLASQIAVRAEELDLGTHWGATAYVTASNYNFGGIAIVDDPANPQNGLFAYYFNVPSGGSSYFIGKKLINGVLSADLFAVAHNDLTSYEQKIEVIRDGNDYKFRLRTLADAAVTITDATVNNCKYFGIITTGPGVVFSRFAAYNIPNFATLTDIQTPWITTGAELTTMQAHPSASNPVLSKESVTGWDGGAVVFVADPFVMEVDGTYYMWFEVSGATKNEIAYATSADGFAWTYGGIVISSKISQTVANAYPYVFQAGGHTWMIPGISTTKIELWLCTHLPDKFEYATTIFSTTYCVDATVFKWGSSWYALKRDTTAGSLDLFVASSLTGTWTEHPSSPIATSAAYSRPAGRPIVRATTIDVPLQDNVAHYGDKVRIYTITTLTPTTFAWAEHASSPILEGTGVPGWNADGFHAWDRVNGGYCVTDALNGSEFSIGIYRDTVP